MTLREKAYQTLRNRILYLDLKPGEKILESQMARELKMGRIPIREALFMLESERLLVRSEGYGFTVAKLNDADIGDYFRIRSALEKIGISMLVERATAADLSRLRRHVDKAISVYAKALPKKVIESDTKFHEMIYRATKSEIFCRTMSSLSDYVMIVRAAALHTEQGRQESLKDHVTLMEALERRDGETLAHLMEKHVVLAPRYYESIRSFISF